MDVDLADGSREPPWPKDVDSDEFEFEAVPSKRRYDLGAASIQLMIENRVADRHNSKRTMTQLEFGRGAPGTRNAESLWVNRFENFRVETVGHSLANPFSRDDMIRFFDSIIGT
jgi:hypothetical protein